MVFKVMGLKEHIVEGDGKRITGVSTETWWARV